MRKFAMPPASRRAWPIDEPRRRQAAEKTTRRSTVTGLAVIYDGEVTKSDRDALEIVRDWGMKFKARRSAGLARVSA
ncbi:hypothetical protein C5L14_00470 [Labrys okinawensis]|uniref:Uncharacterized protein n=1 Tax=Labrys okinawensis TaxID=346911 RepID=A0A2S9QID6_9HYPH|nr:hypothetical protein C5L14_00470 [Labrys okinawensis]